MVGFGKYRMGGYRQIGVYRVKLPQSSLELYQGLFVAEKCPGRSGDDCANGGTLLNSCECACVPGFAGDNCKRFGMAVN